MGSAGSGARIIEEARRLSHSSLWRLQRRYYERTGPEAWSSATVPHYITSNTYIAGAFADVVMAWARDVGGPVTVVELGAGSGRFSYLLMQRLGGAPITYVMTDFAERNLAAWRAHPQLAPYVEAGRLDFALYDVESPERPPVRERAGRPVEGPLVVIANYFFDSIPGDAFVVEAGQLFEGRLAIEAPADAPPAGEVDDPALLEKAELRWEVAPLDGPPYDDPVWSAIVDGYRARRARRGWVQLPVAALRCIDALAKVAGGRLLVLSADKGSVDEEAVVRENPPYVSQHGSISVNVNYHALAEWTAARGGHVLRLPHEHASIEIAGFAFGDEPRLAREVFAMAMGRFGPDDFYTVRKALEPHFETLTVEQALALMRLSDFDPRTFQGLLPVFTKAAQSASAITLRDIGNTVESVGENYFHIGESKDFPFKLGLLLFQLKQYDRAAAWFERSILCYGPHPVTSYNLALCAHRQGDHERASARVEEALRLDPAHEGARSLRRTLEEAARTRATEIVIAVAWPGGAREELAVHGDGRVRAPGQSGEARLPAASVTRLFEVIEASGILGLDAPSVTDGAAAGGSTDGLAIEVNLRGTRRRLAWPDPAAAPARVHELIGAVRLAASLAG
jgi:hypothetical protein